MSIVDFFRGKFANYGKTAGLSSAISLIIVGAVCLLSFSAIFAILGWLMAFFICLIELPWMKSCCPQGPKFKKIVEFFSKNGFRVGMYIIFAFIMWLSLTLASSFYIIPALLLTITALFYLIAVLKRETIDDSPV